MVWKYGGVPEKLKKEATREEILANLLFDRTVSNVAIDKGLVIATGIGGTVYCLDAYTGKLYWSQMLKSAEILSNPLIVDNKVYLTTTAGVWLFEHSKEKKMLGQIEKDRQSYCSPIFANGVLYVAVDGSLYAIKGDEKPTTK